MHGQQKETASVCLSVGGTVWLFSAPWCLSSAFLSDVQRAMEFSARHRITLGLIYQSKSN